MSCSLNQSGGARTRESPRRPTAAPVSEAPGARATKVSEVPGTRKQLENGAVGAYFELSNGKQGFRFIEGAKAGMRVAPRALTQAQAQQAFDKYYSKMPTFTKGPRKGENKYASDKSLARARAYDAQWSLPANKIINDSRYLTSNGPNRYDFAGVDVGSVRPVSAKQAASRLASAARLAALRRPKSQFQERNMQAFEQLPQAQQLGGYWW